MSPIYCELLTYLEFLKMDKYKIKIVGGENGYFSANWGKELEEG